LQVQHVYLNNSNVRQFCVGIKKGKKTNQQTCLRKQINKVLSEDEQRQRSQETGRERDL